MVQPPTIDSSSADNLQTLGQEILHEFTSCYRPLGKDWLRAEALRSDDYAEYLQLMQQVSAIASIQTDLLTWIGQLTTGFLPPGEIGGDDNGGPFSCSTGQAMEGQGSTPPGHPPLSSSEIRALEKNGILPSPTPKSFPHRARDLDSGSPLPTGEELGMRTRLVEKSGALVAASPLSKEPPSKDALLEASSRQQDHASTPPSPVNSSVSGGLNDLAQLLDQHPWEQVSIQQDFGANRPLPEHPPLPQAAVQGSAETSSPPTEATHRIPNIRKTEPLPKSSLAINESDLLADIPATLTQTELTATHRRVDGVGGSTSQVDMISQAETFHDGSVSDPTGQAMEGQGSTPPGHPLLSSSEIRALEKNGIPPSPTPESFPRRARDLDSGSPLPTGEELGMRTRLVEKSGALVAASPLSKEPPSKDALLEAPSRQPDHSSTLPSSVNSSVSGSLSDLAQLLHQHPWGQPSAQQNLRADIHQRGRSEAVIVNSPQSEEYPTQFKALKPSNELRANELRDQPRHLQPKESKVEKIEQPIVSIAEPSASQPEPLQASPSSLWAPPLMTEFSDSALDQLLDAVEKQVNRDYRRFYGKA